MKAREVIARGTLGFSKAVLRDYDVPEDAFHGDPELAESCNTFADAILAALAREGLAVVPVEPSNGLLMSMALRYDHGLGALGFYDQPFLRQEGEPSHAERLEGALKQMAQLHEEVVGAGFYRPEKEDEYVAMLAAARKETDHDDT